MHSTLLDPAENTNDSTNSECMQDFFTTAQKTLRAIARPDRTWETFRGASIAQRALRASNRAGNDRAVTVFGDQRERETMSASMNDTPNPASLSTTLAEYSQTDLGNARRLVARFGDKIKYHYKSSKWYVLDAQNCWTVDKTGSQVMQFAKRTVSLISTEECDSIFTFTPVTHLHMNNNCLKRNESVL